MSGVTGTLGPTWALDFSHGLTAAIFPHVALPLLSLPGRKSSVVPPAPRSRGSRSARQNLETSPTLHYLSGDTILGFSPDTSLPRLGPTCPSLPCTCGWPRDRVRASDSYKCKFSVWLPGCAFKRKRCVIRVLCPFPPGRRWKRCEPPSTVQVGTGPQWAERQDRKSLGP